MRGIYANDALIPSALALELGNNLLTFIKANLWQAHARYLLGLLYPLILFFHSCMLRITVFCQVSPRMIALRVLRNRTWPIFS